MGTSEYLAGVVLIVGTSVALAAPATADYEQYAMNGTYSVVSNGEWARMNDRYQDEPTVRSTWTVTSTCTTALTCAGKVTSSLGWTEDIYTTSGANWFVKHYVPEWIPCPDGGTAPGLQVYHIYPANDDGLVQNVSDTWLGDDVTTGPSGNCGRSKSLVLSLPVKILKIS
ncbi:hypothetical protein [Mycobacterium yunnanensis]|uniref:hypothetical protein n=1 Tax=Mycobacterium yunnanensis TaxID=368477 RepID=UPI0021F325BB|nr:hypothetical protein [Mycobacterium yunnanensis]